MKNYDIILQEIQETRKWVKEKLSIVNNLPLLGFEVSTAEKQLHNLRVNFVYFLAVDDRCLIIEVLCVVSRGNVKINENIFSFSAEHRERVQRQTNPDGFVVKEN